MGLFSSLFGSKKSEYSDDFKQETGQQALDLSDSIRDAMGMVKESSDKEEKILNFYSAVDDFEKVKDMADKYPFLHIESQSLSEVDKEIREIADNLNVDYKPTDQDYPEDAWTISDEVLAEVEEPPGEGQLGASHLNDYLSMASYAEGEALDAIKNKDYDKAWKLLSEVKLLYGKHAHKTGFTQEEAVRLDATVSDHLARILRLEGKHADALVHIIYCEACSQREMTDTRRKKLIAHFNRLKLKNTTDIEMLTFFAYQSRAVDIPDVFAIREQVREWRDKG